MKGKKCKYYNKHLDTISKLIDCLYELEECENGGCLHCLLDDGDGYNSTIEFCLKECDKHPEREEAELGKCICKEFLKLKEQERNLLLYGNGWFDCYDEDCYCCDVEYGAEAQNHRQEKRALENEQREKRLNEFFSKIETDNENHWVYIVQKIGKFYNILRYRIYDIKEDLLILRHGVADNDIMYKKEEVYFIKQQLIDKIKTEMKEGDVIRQLK